MAQNDRTRRDGMKDPKADDRLQESRGADMDMDRDEDRAPGGQGRVKKPDSDRRLKENRE
jgi:hypothetical protein